MGTFKMNKFEPVVSKSAPNGAAKFPTSKPKRAQKFVQAKISVDSFFFSIRK